VKTVAAILAAGASSRLGRPKQLLPFRGMTLVRAIARELCSTSCDRVVVVLGAHSGNVAPALADLPVALAPNVLWSEGVASSIRCAVGWALRERCDALVLVACDQPRLTADHVEELVAVHRETRRPVASRYDGVVGIPVVFGASEFPALVALRGDTGARHVLAAATPAVDWPDGAFDLDTPHDVAREMLHPRE
jgi:CTP:molybdopterin cytidylyltransferase MocA